MSKLISYLPLYWQDSIEMQAVLGVSEGEIESLVAASGSIFADSIVLQASEERIAGWERILQINPEGDLEERRLFVLSVLRGIGKLNETKIKTIVNTFSGGGGAIVTFANSVINVKVLPPHNGEKFRFSDIVRSIDKQKPAHLGLVVERYYSTWGNIKNEFTSWQDLRDSKATWQDVLNHIVRE